MQKILISFLHNFFYKIKRQFWCIKVKQISRGHPHAREITTIAYLFTSISSIVYLFILFKIQRVSLYVDIRRSSYMKKLISRVSRLAHAGTSSVSQCAGKSCDFTRKKERNRLIVHVHGAFQIALDPSSPSNIPRSGATVPNRSERKG